MDVWRGYINNVEVQVCHGLAGKAVPCAVLAEFIKFYRRQYIENRSANQAGP